MIKSENKTVSVQLGGGDGYQDQSLLNKQGQCVTLQSNSPNLLDLNDDCLLEVLQYVSVQEAFSLIGAFGSRFDNIVHKRIAQLKQLCISLRDPPSYSPTQLQIIGQHLKTLNFSVGYSLDSDRCITQYFRPLCHHGSIQTLTLHYVTFTDGYQQCILNLALYLQFLDLSFCQLTDDLLQPVLENSLQLKVFVAIGNYDLKGVSFHSIKSGDLNTMTLELNDQGDDEVHRFIANNPGICVKVFEKGRQHFKIYHKGQLKHTSIG